MIDVGAWHIVASSILGAIAMRQGREYGKTRAAGKCPGIPDRML